MSGPNTETKTTILTQQHNNKYKQENNATSVTQKLCSEHTEFSPLAEEHCLLQWGDQSGQRRALSSKLDVVQDCVVIEGHILCM